MSSSYAEGLCYFFLTLLVISRVLFCIVFGFILLFLKLKGALLCPTEFLVTESPLSSPDDGTVI